MTNTCGFQKRLRFAPASSVPVEVGKQDTSDSILRQECQCDGDNLRMATWNSVPAQCDKQDSDGNLRQKSHCGCGISRIISWNSWTLLPLLLFGWCFCVTSQGADAFVIPEITTKHYKMPTKVDTKLWYQEEYKEEGDDEDDTNKNISSNSGEDNDLWGGDADLEAPSEAVDHLSWKLAKIRLEQENTKRFLKAGPRFLPYEECRNWVTAWNRWETEEDWKTWIREGEKRNAYIPARPDEYYGRLGKWKGWAHFLGREEDDECEGGGEGGEDMPVGEGDGAEEEK